MAKTFAQLTQTQQDALTQIRGAGEMASGNGIRLSTVEVLEREGFVTVQRISREGRRTEWVAKPVKAEESKAPAKSAKTPHGPTLVRLAKGLGFEKANMPEAGGFIVREVLWEMVPVFMIGWAYKDRSMDDRSLTPEVRKLAETFEERGYALDCLRDDRNFFFVIPEPLVPFRRTA